MKSISIDEKDLIYSPLPWQKMGLQQTASGYGRKLTTTKKYRLNGRLYRVYCCQYSNSGTAYIIVDKECIVLN